MFFLYFYQKLAKNNKYFTRNDTTYFSHFSAVFSSE